LLGVLVLAGVLAILLPFVGPIVLAGALSITALPRPAPVSIAPTVFELVRRRVFGLEAAPLD
jgi:hypothetical protein